jgi:C1A family cysteine protease
MYLRPGVNSIIIVLVLCLGLYTPFAYADNTSNVTNQTVAVSLLTQNPTQHPLMHLSKAQLNEEEAQFRTMEKYAPLQTDLLGISTLVSKSLLSSISYIPAERDQGQCGDCWVWASTGALEIDHTVKTGINKRLSIQYLNSKFNNGVGADWACCGGSLQTFTSWYNIDRTPIPWSNTNAAFGDASQECADYATTVPIGTISTTPHYTINSITNSTISTYGVGQSTAIANIKNAINNNKGVYYSFHYGTTGWTAFYNFWDNQAESVIFNPDSYGGEEDEGGHGVLIVGYDTSDPSNPYWIVLNSWGTTAGRPNGLFRLKMSMNYDNTYTYNSSTYTQHKYYVLNAVFPPNDGDNVGVFRSPTHIFVLKNGTINTTVIWGTSTDIPVTGDWNGDGLWDVGVFRNSTHRFILKNGSAATVVNWGLSTDKPVTGDWNGDGLWDVGVYRPLTHIFVLKNGTVNTTVNYGWSGMDIPVTGDWNGDGLWDVGVYRSLTHIFVLKNGTINTTVNYGWSGTDIPVTGDWNGDSMGDVGVYRSLTHIFVLKNGTRNTTVNYGWSNTDIPITGKWS